MIDKFIKSIHNEIILIHNNTSHINKNTNIDEKDYEKYIKLKGLDFFEIYFNLLKDHKDNIKYFITKELNEYYKNYNQKIYPLYLSFQTYLLNKLEEYKEEEKINETFRDLKQNEYVKEIVKTLNSDNKVFIKAPTGFGKTVLYYKTIKQMEFKKILIFTPRLLLNEQIVESKYFNHIGDEDYKIIHFSNSIDLTEKEKKINKIKKYSINKKKFVITSCYQSKNKLLELVLQNNIIFDLIIFDEAHTIESWEDSEFVLSNTISEYKIFGSATPTENIEMKPNIFGKLIEKVKIYELINNKILCDIVTLVKKLENKKKEYHNLKNMIVEIMLKYKKNKGIIYVNKQVNAQNLYDLMIQQKQINTYIYVSGEVKVDFKEHTNIKAFEDDIIPSVIIVVGKISYGYDNPLIDFLCLGDPRQSDIDIRQILGRGLRWDKTLYPDKLLHLLVPLYQDEFGNYPPNSCLKNYLDYIIGECGHDIIIKEDGSGIVKSNNDSIKFEDDGEGYDGYIPSLEKNCTDMM